MSSLNQEKLILTAEYITKEFPGVKALDNVTFQLKKNEIHALVGENGAGKSTFSKILAGEYKPTSGSLYLNGQSISIQNTMHAINLGIGMVYQERNLVPYFTAVENIFLGKELISSGLLNNSQMQVRVQKMMAQIGVEFEMDQPVSKLGPSKQQLAEIIRVLLLKPQIMIFDEPSSSLTQSETKAFFGLLKKIKKDVSIIFISHRLEEVFEISDRITVFRDGKKIDTVDTKKVDKDEVIKMMVDRDITELYPKKDVSIGETLLKVNKVSTDYLEEINFEVKKGEILGFSGMVGSGRTELAEVIFGLKKFNSGSIVFDGEGLSLNKPADVINKGIYLIPEDRRVEGLNLEMDVRQNLSLVHLQKACSGLFINKNKEKDLASKLIDKFDIRISDQHQKVLNLSGGNQQKVVIGKWLARQAKLLIMDEATAGIDVGAKREIYKIIVELAAKGVSIIYISSDLPELMGICDRIYVMESGKIAAEYPREEFSQEKILESAVVSKGPFGGDKR